MYLFDTSETILWQNQIFENSQIKIFFEKNILNAKNDDKRVVQFEKNILGVLFWRI